MPLDGAVDQRAGEWLAGPGLGSLSVAWQVELLIKRFKSEARTTQSAKAERVESEWYLKLLGQVVRNWLQLL